MSHIEDAYCSTFSIVARCVRTEELGVGVCTALPFVGSTVPHVKARVGAIATQAHISTLYGTNGLKLLEAGFSPETTLEAMLKEDSLRERRQITMIDCRGCTAAFTGRNALEWKGHLAGDGYVVAGNLLSGKRVIENMAETFSETEKNDLADRMIEALEAGLKAGGDRRGNRSAAIIVRREEGIRPFSSVDLRVDDHDNPVKELRRLCSLHRRIKAEAELERH